MKKIMFSIKNITTTPIPTAGKSAYLQEEEIWGNGPVHFTPKGYSLAAAGLESVIYEKRAEEKEDEAGGWQGAPKRPNQEPAGLG